MSWPLNPPGSRRTAGLLGMLVVVAALWSYREAMGFEFVAMDDDINIYFNPHLGPPTWENLKWMFTNYDYVRRYMPLGWLGYSVVYSFSGLSPVGYHLANLGLHLVNALLVYALIAQLLIRRGGGGSLWRSVCAALGAGWWAVHPFRAETVGWSSGLLYGQAGCLALLSVLAYLNVHGATGLRRIGWLSVTIGLYTASLLTYPIGLGWVAIYWLIDWRFVAGSPGTGIGPWWRDPRWPRLLKEKFALAVPLVAVLEITVYARYNLISFWREPPTDQPGLDLVGRAMQAAYVWAHYIWKTVWPTDLTPAPTDLVDFDPHAWPFLVSAVAVAGLTLILATRKAWRRGPLLWWLTYLAILVPMLGLTEHPHYANDRYAYLPGVLMSLVAALALERLRYWGRKLAVAVGVFALVGYALASRAQLLIWRDTDALQARMIGLAKDDMVAASNYRRWALFHAQLGGFERAEIILAEGRRRYPDNPQFSHAHNDLGRYHRMLRPDAVSEYRSIAAMLHLKMALDFVRQGRGPEASNHFRRAVVIDGEFSQAAFNWALFEASQGEAWLALRLFYHRVATADARVVSAAHKAKLMTLIGDAFATRGESRLTQKATEQAARLLK